MGIASECREELAADFKAIIQRIGELEDRINELAGKYRTAPFIAVNHESRLSKLEKRGEMKPWEFDASKILGSYSITSRLDCIIQLLEIDIEKRLEQIWSADEPQVDPCKTSREIIKAIKSLLDKL